MTCGDAANIFYGDQIEGVFWFAVDAKQQRQRLVEEQAAGEVVPRSGHVATQVACAGRAVDCVTASLEFVDEPAGVVPLKLVAELRPLRNKTVRCLEQNKLG